MERTVVARGVNISSYLEMLLSETERHKPVL